ncbi:hypothetical protein F0U44_19790 [Nocardioides humilatus]|uniref:Uncharacterized protein n=1 Tax=Nocardioides humilatus TaxID=2607660 RepID=A0A5B1L7Y0_9ACTN|nr:hypothetical protein [Nocardioides humilatus]KAA1415880.1 hypothetical protein F0U44_19790 [Nocardioides humilatus]
MVATVPTARAALRACVEPLLAYAFALAASVGLMLLVVAAIAADSDGGDSDPAEDIDIKAIGTLVGIPFQLAGMALGGSLRLGAGAFSVSLFAPPLLVTAVFVAAVFILSQRAERATPSASTPERVILAAAGASATAVAVAIATRLLAMRSDGASLHAASVGLFLGAFALAFGSAVAGRVAAQGSLWPRWLPPDGRRALHLVTQHVLAYVAVVVPVAAVWLLIESGPEAALFAVVWGPTVAFWAFGLGHVGAVTALGEQQFAWDLGWFLGVVLPLLAVVLTLASAIAWHLRRGDDRELLAMPASWASLPIAYGSAALVVCLLSTVGLSGGFYDLGGGFTVHTAYWLIAVLAFWGALVEVLSRFVAPALARVVPAMIAKRLAVGPAQLWSPDLIPAQRIPMSPPDRARATKALIGVGVLAGLALAGGIALSVVGATMYSPEAEAEDYLDALVDADAGAALDLAPVDDDEASSALLTDQVYGAADDRITGYEITDVEEFGDTVTVTVDLEGVEDGDDVELTLVEDGNRGLFFHGWKVDEGGLASELTVSVPEDSTAVEVNGVSVPVVGGEDVDFWALPGSYVVNPYGGSEWLEPVDAETVVPASSWGVYAEIDDPEPSAALKTFVDDEVARWVEGCMAATEADPADCPQEIYPYGDEQRNLTWTLDTLPTVSWDGFYGTFPAGLSSDVDGEATATYEYDESYGYGKPHWVEATEDTTFYLNVTVDLIDGEPQVTIDSY